MSSIDGVNLEWSHSPSTPSLFLLTIVINVTFARRSKQESVRALAPVKHKERRVQDETDELHIQEKTSCIINIRGFDEIGGYTYGL